MSPEIYSVLSLASRWLFAFFALMLLFFALVWHHSERKERRDRFKNLPGAGTIGEFVVLSGGEELTPDTWFPVPREGVLGSLRSCDLVIPCAGVRSQHLDFSWQDGTGLMIRPRIGCEALVDGIPVSRRGTWADAPMRHGSLLQVGEAMLRLQLFSALSHTNMNFTPQAQTSGPQPPAGPVQVAPPQVMQSQLPQQQILPQDLYAAPQGWTAPPSPVYPAPQEQPSLQEQPLQQEQPEPGRRKRADRWKEDWSE